MWNHFLMVVIKGFLTSYQVSQLKTMWPFKWHFEWVRQFFWSFLSQPWNFWNYWVQNIFHQNENWIFYNYYWGPLTLIPRSFNFKQGLIQCCACKWFGTYTPCKGKNKYIYIILCGPIKQCKCLYLFIIIIILHSYVKQCKYRTM
jgi:hypothetical protein